MRRGWVLLGLVVAGLVGWSLLNQLRRPATVGEQVHRALEKANGPLGAPPVLMDYVPGERKGMFALEVGGEVLGIDRAVRWVEVRGDVRPPEETPEDGGIRLVAPGRTLGISPQVSRVELKAGPGEWVLAVAGPGYRMERTRGGGGVYALANGPLAEIGQAALIEALRPSVGWGRLAEEVVASERKGLGELGEFELFQEWIAADGARLDRANDAVTACRRALPLLMTGRGSVVLRWPEDAVFAVTEWQKTTTGESRVRLFGFASDGKGGRGLAWYGTGYFEAKVPPEEVRRVISGMVGEGGRGR